MPRGASNPGLLDTFACGDTQRSQACSQRHAIMCICLPDDDAAPLNFADWQLIAVTSRLNFLAGPLDCPCQSIAAHSAAPFCKLNNTGTQTQQPTTSDERNQEKID